MMIINHNLSALSAFSSLRMKGSSLQKAMKSLTTGLRINSASDDAAGLAVSERLRAQLRGVDRAIQNTQDGISMLQTAEGGLESITSALQKMRELSVQAANDVLTQQDRGQIQSEIDQLKQEIKRVTDSTKFNKKNLLNGEASVLWSSDDEKLRARVNGALASKDDFGQKMSIEGNYKFEISSKAGKAEVQKSSILEYSRIPGDLGEGGNGQASNVARILFLVDNSATMATSIARVRDNINAFVENIKAKGVDNVEIGICTYNTYEGLVARDFSSGLWSSDAEEIESVLDSIDCNPSDMNNYDAAVGAIDIYGASFGTNSKTNQRRYMVTITDIDHVASQYTGTSKESSVLSSISGGPGVFDDIQFSAICPRTDATSEFYNAVHESGGVMFNIGEDWSNNLTVTFASKIAADTLGEDSLDITSFPPEADTKLTYISKFISSDGSFILDEPQKLTITQGGNSATITLYKEDTIKEMAQKINDAIAFDLGQGRYTDDASHFAEYVDNPTQGIEAVPGTIVIRSVIPGEEGKLRFSGSDELLNALGLNTIKEAEESEYKVSVTDAHTGEYLLTDEKVTGNVLHSAVTESIDVEFDSMSGITAVWDGINKEYRLTSSGTRSSVLHLSDNATKIQTGANEGEDMTLMLGDVSAKTLGIDKIDVSSRETASSSVTIIDLALDKVLTHRARNAAQQAVLEHRIQSLMTARENITKSESTIRDADIAKTMMEYVKITTLNQAEVAVLSQANQVSQSVLSIMR